MKAKDLKNAILQMAVQGKLVPQDPSDEPASTLLERIREERANLIKEKKTKAPKGGESVIYRAEDGSYYEKRIDAKGRESEPVCIDDEIPFDIPETWEWVRLTEIAQRIHYGFSCSSTDTGTIKLLRITDIQNNTVDWSSVPYCATNPNRLSDYELSTSDILIARTGGTVGKHYIVQDSSYASVFASYLIRVVLIEKALTEYSDYYLDSPLYWNQLTSSVAGTGQPNVNSAALGNLLVPLPPLAEQHRIVKRIAELVPLIEGFSKLDSNQKLDK